ncbi:MAG: hypothetical protein P1U35_13415 [Cycloclasticus sp.]|nr:hypothetical protein [Cycloclasticus sp.]
MSIKSRTKVKMISDIKKITLKIDKLLNNDKPPKKQDIKRANRQLKDVSKIIGLNIEIEENNNLKKR